MCPNRYSNQAYAIAECSLNQTPADDINFRLWPKRESFHKPIAYCEWFDWAELFSSGAERKLCLVASLFGSSDIFVAGTSVDFEDEFRQTVRVIQFASTHLAEVYFRAIWDKRSMLPSEAIASVARTVNVWDESGKWTIFNDRYYEIGVFVIFGVEAPSRPIFSCFDEQTLSDRFSVILSTGKIASLDEIRRWQR